MRAIQPGEEVQVYWNFHKKCFSVQARTGTDKGRVIAHVSEFALEGVKFVIGKAGQRRVREEGRKNVHAFVRGAWSGDAYGVGYEWVYYNPYKVDTFVTKHMAPVHTAVKAIGDSRSGMALIFAQIA